jgi:hypothetical protein
MSLNWNQAERRWERARKRGFQIHLCDTPETALPFVAKLFQPVQGVFVKILEHRATSRLEALGRILDEVEKRSTSDAGKAGDT